MDRGLAYGDGVFRTLQHNGYPYCWGLHYHRLEADCNTLGIVCPSADALLDDIARLQGVEESSVIKLSSPAVKVCVAMPFHLWRSLRAL